MNLATPAIKILTRFKQNHTDYDVSHISDKEGPKISERQLDSTVQPFSKLHKKNLLFKVSEKINLGRIKYLSYKFKREIVVLFSAHGCLKCWFVIVSWVASYIGYALYCYNIFFNCYDKVCNFKDVILLESQNINLCHRKFICS